MPVRPRYQSGRCSDGAEHDLVVAAIHTERPRSLDRRSEIPERVARSRELVIRSRELLAEVERLQRASLRQATTGRSNDEVKLLSAIGRDAGRATPACL
jgi:hypothetical protein